MAPAAAAARATDAADAAAADDTLKIMPLGAGSEVGRSAIVVSYMGKQVMLDCGIHPGYSGMASLPFFDEVELDKIDVCLVTHFHLDHCAAVPYLLAHTNFKGRIFMTHPTKAVYRTLLADFVRVSKGSSGEQLYTERDLDASMERIEVVDFHQEIDVDGIKFKPYMAGHVLGAAMFQVEIAGVSVLYTGDYSRQPDRHLAAAEIPERPPHVVIVESTYGVQSHTPKAEREQRFGEMVMSVIRRGGKLLLPVVALGRAQELLLILEDFWKNHPELQSVPIFQASALARRSMSIYQTYINMMNSGIREAFELANPFDFKFVKHMQGSAGIEDHNGPCVVMATPSMLQSGLSRELFEAWCEDKRNGVIIADFAVQGTLAREVLQGPAEVTTKAGLKVPLRCTVDAISFSAHADFPQTQGFLDKLRPQHVVLVHGEVNEMGRLKHALEAKAQKDGYSMAVYTPKNVQPVSLPFKFAREARVMGTLANKVPEEGSHVGGLLVRKGFNHTLIDVEDAHTYTGLRRTTITQRQAVPCTRHFWEVRLAVEQLFEGVHSVRTAAPIEAASRSKVKVEGDAAKTEDGGKEVKPAAAAGSAGDPLKVSVGGKVTMTPNVTACTLVLEWESDPVADMVADAIVAVVMQLEEEPALAAAEENLRRARSREDAEAAEAAELEILSALLAAQFGRVETDEELRLLTFSVDGIAVTVRHNDKSIECEDEGLRDRVQRALQRVETALFPVDLGEADGSEVNE
uniref:Cleavage and polyadenylation specificity factor subunit 3 n=1 Tax=Prasinoderma coloniale TaxID=156133 RepID=A0A7R9Y201_9VIRI|eukprot:PRCOL_00001441-RA